MGIVTLEAIKPIIEKSDYTEATAEFWKHLKEAIKRDILYRHGVIGVIEEEYNCQDVKSRVFKITINGKCYTFKMDKWSPINEDYDSWVKRLSIQVNIQIHEWVKLAEDAFKENCFNELDLNIQLIAIENKSPLTNEQIKKLLPRINSSYARSIYRSWTNNPNDQGLNSEARRLAQLTVDKYGLAIVKYIISLPFTHSANSNLKLYSTSDKNEVPLHTIQVNIDGDEQLVINFHLVSNPNRQKRAYVFKKNKEKEVKLIGYINQDGELKTNQVYKRYFNPELLVVLNQQNKVLYGGLHPGNCIECGKELTVPESIILGIGPECYQKYGHLTLPDIMKNSNNS
jgi:hypothetical protein